MNIRIILDKRRSNKDGMFPLKLSFSNLRKTVYHSLNIYVYEHEFDEKAQTIFSDDKKRNNQLKQDNSFINNQLNRATDILRGLRMSGKDNILPSRFKELFVDSNDNNTETFNSFFNEFIKTKKQKTAEIYQSTLNKIEKYYGNNIYFEDVTYGWLEKFERTLHKEGLKINAISIHLRNIRSVFNNAIDKNKTSIESYPFRRFKIKSEETIKRSININQLILLFNYNKMVQLARIGRVILQKLYST